MQKNVFYEIEMKALISEDIYNHLRRELPLKHPKVTEETTQTLRFRPHDIRLRSSDNRKYEFIYKEGDPTTLSRREIIVPLPSQTALENMKIIFSSLGFKPDPPWTKHKLEILRGLNGFNYIICVQHIENFAYLLEVEHISNKDDSQIHRPNLEKIITDMGCVPINPRDFKAKINEYIAANRKT